MRRRNEGRRGAYLGRRHLVLTSFVANSGQRFRRPEISKFWGTEGGKKLDSLWFGFALLCRLVFSCIRGWAVDHGRRFPVQLDTHAQMGSVVDGVFGRAIGGGLDARGGSAEGASWNLKKGEMWSQAKKQESGGGKSGNTPRRSRETGNIAIPWK
jgi:hypothetical protein